ncbi:3-deoxy-7-phosphoheptulonate synthase [Sphingomonas sp. LY54]|nr:3-deoxy-7-phosphoheptulonate synthase [Sphingomonas sp. LY54]WRP27939.1 3-deoxy-7-phosphoheptulonate synthase [Sphingomonas sp. LY54]
MTHMISAPLAALRSEIDRLDDAILDLVERRIAVSADVARSKPADGLLKIRPRREDEVIERQLGRARRAPAALVTRLWRELMAHGLQAQASTEIVLCEGNGPSLAPLVRDRFGSAAPLRRVATPAAALEAAQQGEAIAVICGSHDPHGGSGLTLFDRLHDTDGGVVAHVLGRVAPQDARKACGAPAQCVAAVEMERHDLQGWTPADWRHRPAAQMPVYPDAEVLAQVEAELAAAQPLVHVADISHLKNRLAEVAAGRAFLLQGGDCAESFAEFGADKVRTTFNLLLQMSALLRAESDCDVVHLARIAGQFAKPRSSLSETIDGVTLPSYRGDAVNGAAFTHASRTPDPNRLLDALRQAQVTVELLDAYAAAAYADIPELHRSVGSSEAARPVHMFTSHEALLLNYEQALTRFDPETGRWWARSGHMIWIGDRTRTLDGAHVEYARGVANPVGLKCGPTMTADELLRLIDTLDPENEPGRLVLIGRFGASAVADHLPALMRATRREGRNAIWSVDPMHGNTRSAGALKTRLLGDIVAEIETFFEVAHAERVHAGGVHLEMTGADVTECLGGSLPLVEADLPRRYLTHCDPRLNRAQAIDVAAAIAKALAKRQLRSDAA